MFSPTERYMKHDIFHQTSEYDYHQICLTGEEKPKKTWKNQAQYRGGLWSF